MKKLEVPLYHGTSGAAAIYIVGGNGFNPPLYLCEDKQRALHYAKAATAYLEEHCRKAGSRPIKEGCALVTVTSVPNSTELVEDDYNKGAEPGQWKYLKRLRGLQHFSIEYFPLEANEEEHLRLQCFAIGMWRS